jgi:hypothetical protein
MELKMDALSEQVMVNLISNRLDVETRKAYEIQPKADALPKWDETLHSFFNKDAIRSNQLNGGITALY